MARGAFILPPRKASPNKVTRKGQYLNELIWNLSSIPEAAFEAIKRRKCEARRRRWNRVHPLSEKINYPKMGKIARLACQASWDLANAAARPRLLPVRVDSRASASVK